MDRISLFLPNVLNKRGLQKQATASLVVYQAQEWLNRTLPEFEADLHVQRLSDGTLMIQSRHSIASQEAQQVLPMLLQYLQTECEQRTVESIQIQRA